MVAKKHFELISIERTDEQERERERERVRERDREKFQNQTTTGITTKKEITNAQWAHSENRFN